MQHQSDKTGCHELRVIATSGRVFLLTVADARRLALSRVYLASLAIYCVVLAAADPRVFTIQVALPWRVLFWLSSATLLTVFWVGLFWLCAVIGRRYRRHPVVPMAVILIVATGATQLVNDTFATGVLGLSDVWEGPVWSELLRYALIVIAFEVMLSTLLFPSLFRELSRKNEARAEIRARVQAGEKKPAPAGPRFLSAGGQDFALDDLLYLKSVENYVEVVMRDGSAMIRAALKDLTRQLDAADGMQTHRSYWVARGAAVGMVRQGGNAVILLTNGAEIPVSRQRRPEVAAWIDGRDG